MKIEEKKKTKAWIIGIIVTILVVVVSVIIIISTKNDNSNDNQNSIIGTWEYNNNEKTSYIFYEDGTCMYNIDVLKCTYKFDGEKIEILYEGWKSAFNGVVNDDQLIITDSLGGQIIYERK